MANKAGVYKSYKKDGTAYYRSSITYKNKHISLGSFPTEKKANKVYEDATAILRDGKWGIEDYKKRRSLPLDKFIVLVNYRDSGIYLKNPIYLRKKYLEYYLSTDEVIKFDREDLFFYGKHKIQTRGGYMFYCDYGSQYNVLSRYGIKNFSVKGRDYIFTNGDEYDYRYENIKVINNYMGVQVIHKDGREFYESIIHINGNFIVGRYDNDIDAAIAYNKAADELKKQGIEKNYIRNYITSITNIEYAKRYNLVKISEKIRHMEG